MKKFLTLAVLLVGLLLTGTANSQNLIKASAYYGSTPTSIIIVLKPNFAFNDKLNEAGFAIQVPKVVGGSPIAMPTITVLNNFLATTFPTATWSASISESSDPNYYNYKFGATALPTAPVLNVPSGTELQVLELQISASPTAIPLVRLAHLADGGPNSQYGVAIIDGSLNDLTDYAQMFYGPGTVPAIPAVDQSAGYSTYQYVTATTFPLPVKFLGFNVVKKEKDAVLTWQIENETSITDRYEIERSANGVDFTRVTTITPKNNGSSTNTYTFSDINQLADRSGGVVYYRIKQIDKDGKFIITPIRNLRLDSRAVVINVYPNPVKDFANITFDLLKDENVIVTVNDAAGKQVQNISYTLFKGLNVKKINMASLASGSYLLKVSTATEMKTIPLVKRN